MKRVEFAIPAERSHHHSDGASAFGFLEMLLPPAAAPLIILLLLVVPIVLLTAESLFNPLYTWIQFHFMSAGSGEASSGELPSYFFLKLGTFVVLSFLGGFQLLLRIKSIYYSTWARLFPRPHPLHVNYQQDTNRGMVALIQWKLYQFAFIVLPPLLISALTFIVALVELYLFNTFSDLTFIGMSVQLTIELFVIMMLCLFSVFAVFNSIWTALSSLFGDVVAVTEPDLANSIIMQRCGRIAFSSPGVYLLFGAYLVLIGFILAEMVWLIEAVDIYEFISFQSNTPFILLLEACSLAAYIGFNFLKFYTYHHGLSVYYNKLPTQLKECFSPPP